MKIKNTSDEDRIWQALLESRAVEEGKISGAIKAIKNANERLSDDDDEEDEDVKEEGTDGKTGDLTEREKFLLAKKAGDKGEGPLADDEEDEDVKEEGTKGTEEERKEADTNDDGELDEDEKVEANKDREKEGKEHLCAKEVKHESFGAGTCIPERHGKPINGHVSWYTVIFEHDTEVVDTKDLTIIASEMHKH